MSEGPLNRSEQTDRLLVELVERAEPVDRIYPLGRVAIGVTLTYVAWWMIGLHWLGGDASGVELLMAASRGFIVGLLSSVVGATAYTLATREPGRVVMARGALGLMLVGGVAMFGTMIARGDDLGPLSLPMEFMCMREAALLGLPPALVLFGVALGGWRGRPLVTSLMVSISGVSAGALIVQVTCPSDGAWHVMLGHYIGPLLLAVGFGAVVAAVWRARQS